MKTRNNQSNADETLLNQSITRRSFVKRGAVASAATVFGVIIPVARADNGIYGYVFKITVPAGGWSEVLSLNNLNPVLPDGQALGLKVKNALTGSGKATLVSSLQGYYTPAAFTVSPADGCLTFFRPNPEGTASAINVTYTSPGEIQVTIKWGTPVK